MTTGSQRFLAGVTGLILLIGAVGARADQTNDAPPRSEHKVFFFEGGRPIDFIMAIDRHFRTRMQQILSIPSSLARASVPKMKLAAKEPTDPLCVYNNLHDPALGEWKWQGPAADPAVLALVGDKEGAAPKKAGSHVRAFSIGALPKDLWEKVEADIEAAQRLGQKVTPDGSEDCQGTIRIQPDSKVMLAAGTDTYINMVESIIAAHLANLHAEATKPADSK